MTTFFLNGKNIKLSKNLKDYIVNTYDITLMTDNEILDLINHFKKG